MHGMALTHDRMIQMRVNDEFVRRVDDWRRQQPELPSRSEALRYLIELGLQAAQDGTKRDNKSRA